MSDPSDPALIRAAFTDWLARTPMPDSELLPQQSILRAKLLELAEAWAWAAWERSWQESWALARLTDDE